MRIVHVSDCFLPRMGGIERQVDDLARRQHADGHDVEVITTVAGPPTTGQIRVHRPAERGSSQRIRYLHSWPASQLVRDNGYDLVHVHISTWSPLAFLAARAACARGVPVAATVHSMWDYATPLFAASSRTVGWRSWPIAWSAVSAASAGPLTTMLDGPVSIIPNGIDVAAWAVPPRRSRPDRVVIASVLRLAARKRPRPLLRMLEQLRRSVPERIRLEAALIGDGPLLHSLQTDVHTLGIGDWVTLTGALSRSDIHDRYHDVDLYVAPAALESFGIAALEARSAGLPVVARENTGVAEFIRPGVNGLLAKGDGDMVAALRRLSTDVSLRSAIAMNNRLQSPPMTWAQVMADCHHLYARAHAQARSTLTPRSPRRALPASR